MQRLTRTARQAALLIGLLTLFFVLLSWQVNQAATLSTARGAVFGVVSPLQRIASGVAATLTGFWDGYFGLVGAADEARELAARNAELEREISTLGEAESENRRLRAMLGLEEAIDRPHQPATVIGRDIAHRYQSLTLDRGSADGITPDAPVLAPNGTLVGRVVQVARWTSLVQLITDPFAGVGARLVFSRASGLIAGTDGPLLELRYIDTMTEIREGELVISSGEDGIYPSGLPIGRVRSFAAGPPVPGTPRVPLSREETALFMEVSVDPMVDVTRLETVLVLGPEPEG